MPKRYIPFAGGKIALVLDPDQRCFGLLQDARDTLARLAADLAPSFDLAQKRNPAGGPGLVGAWR